MATLLFRALLVVVFTVRFMKVKHTMHYSLLIVFCSSMVVFFDRVGRQLIGTPLISLVRHGRPPAMPLSEVIGSLMYLVASS